MRAALIGHTGFVGTNLLRQTQFSACYNSTNIAEIRGREFDLLVCTGISALKWWTNQNSAEDLARIQSLLDCVSSVRASRVFVISTIDVYPVVRDVDENYNCHLYPNHAYGTNRLYFEESMRAKFEKVFVCRLPGVFGPGLKKNVIFDLLQNNGLDAINPASSFQYYNILNLWRDLQQAQAAMIGTMNFVHPPVRTQAIIDQFFPGQTVGSRATPEVHYDVRTIYSQHFGDTRGYLGDGSQLFTELGDFIDAEKARLQG